MAFEIVRSHDSIKDLDLIFDHLVASYSNLGDAPADAVNRAAGRIRIIRAEMESIANAPYQGTVLNHMAIGLRSVTKNNAAFYFDVDGPAQTVRILAIFFGGQDHRQHMLKRLGNME
jgi:plasmid stabilization system protein ParE